MRTSGVLALAFAVQLGISVVLADSTKLDSVETVELAYPDTATRTQLLDQLRTLWMNKLNQFQLVDVPKVQFMGEKKNIGIARGKQGGQPLNKVTYRLTGSTALPFNLNTVRSTFKDAAYAAHMGPIGFSLIGSGAETEDVASGAALTGKPFSYTARIYLKYVQDADKIPLLTQVQDVWQGVLSDQNAPSDDLTITITDNQPAGQTNVHRITYRVSGTADYDDISWFGKILAFVNDAIQRQHSQFIFVSLPGTPTVAPTTGHPFSFDTSVYLQYVQDAKKIPLLQQVTDLWKSVLADHGTPSDDLTITITDNVLTSQRNIHKVSCRVSGTASYFDSNFVMGMFLDAFDQLPLVNIFATLPAIPDVTPVVVPSVPGTAKPFNYTASVHLVFEGNFEMAIPLLQQIANLWKIALADQNIPANDLAITIFRDQQTSQTNVHNVTYRVTGTVSPTDLSHFDSILAMVNDRILSEGLENMFVTMPTGSINYPTTMRPITETAGAASVEEAFDYTATIYLLFTRDFEKTSLLDQLAGVWRTALADFHMPATALSITVTSDQPTGQTNIHKITYRVTGSASYADMRYFDTILAIVNENIENQQLNNFFVNLPTGKVNPVPVTAVGTSVKPFSYTGYVYLMFERDFQKTSLLEQLAGIWRYVLAGERARASAVTITVARDEPTDHTDIHEIIYRVTGSASYDTIAYFDRIAGIVNDSIHDQKLRNVFVTLPGRAAAVGLGWNSETFSMAFLPITLLMTYTSTQERDKLAQQVLRVMQDALIPRYNINARDVAISSIDEEPSRYGLNTMQVTVTITVRYHGNGDIDSKETTDLIVQLLKSRPILGVDFVPLGNSWNNVPKVDGSAQGKSDVDVSTTTPKPQPSWVKPQPQPAWKPQPQSTWTPQPAAWKPAPATTTTSRSVTWEPMVDDLMVTTKSSWKPQTPTTWKPSGPGQINIDKVDNKIKVDMSLIPSYQVAPTNIYLISDQFRLTSNSDSERSSYMDQLDSAWQTAIGNTTEFVQLVLYRDDALPGQNSNTHDLGYVVVIVSSNANLDINPFKATFDRIKPRPPVGLVTFAADLVPSPYAFLVLRDTIPRAYSSNGERDSFLAKLQQLYVEALGKDALTVALAVFDDDLLDRMLDVTSGSQIKDLHQLSYFVLIVSNRIMDEDDVQHRFQQYLISRAVGCVV